MTYDELIGHYDHSAEKAADALKLTRQGVHRWKTRGIPIDQQIAYEIATNGALKADLPYGVRERVA